MTNITPTYLFYDIETTGLNPCFDQILQFAAIRTDIELNELQRYEFNVRLNNDVIPAPAALITHRIGLQRALTGEDEYTAVRKIHQLINTPGTISIGYNNLGFDDEFLRYAFYHNLLSPYTHQFANQCYRMDLYPITIMFYLHQTHALQWPQINGDVSLKLENLNTANQLTTGRAHDAMVDVSATLALAKKFYQHRDMWHYLQGYFDKATDQQRQQKLNNHLQIGTQQFSQAIMVKGKLGTGQYYQAPVIKLGQHYHYKNQTIWLRLDHPLLRTTTVDTIATTTFAMRKKAGEQDMLLPLQPQYSQYLTEERKALMTENQNWLQQNPELVNNICHYHLDYKYPEVPQADIDARLYMIGFPSPNVEALFKQFHLAPHHEKMQVAELFPDEIRRQQALRLMGRNFAHHLTPTQQQQFEHYRQPLFAEQATQLPIDYRGNKKLSKTDALEQTQQLLQGDQLDAEQRQLLAELQDYLLG